MPYSVFFLILLAVVVFAFIDVGLGQLRPDPFGYEGQAVRLGLREFATRPVPIFLFGIGVAMLPVRFAAGAGLLLLAGGLALFGRRGRPGRRVAA
ncbi:MAG: hypothetical protein P4L39_00500 [Humidesulfovibrio sp.]|nr:hypothetical protein [Humidesulfovibrio sp.]